MRMRGASFYQWADSQLANCAHVEDYGAGYQIDVVVRVSRAGITQLFLGVYDALGVMLIEEYQRALSNQTPAQAMAWGIDRGKAFIDGTHDHTVLLMHAPRRDGKNQRSSR